MMRRWLMILPVVLFAGHASATGTISCESTDGLTGIDLTIGSLPVLRVTGASIHVGDRQLTLGEAGDDALAVGQAFREDDRILVDFTDPNIENIRVALRLIAAQAGTDFVTAGTLTLMDEGAFAVTCVGP